MPQNGTLKLDLVDVFGRRLQERVDVSLRNLQLTHAPVLRGLDASRLINITNLFSGSQGIYEMNIDPPSYHPVSRFVNVRSGNPTEVTVPFPVDIEKIVSVTFPTFPNLPRELRTLLTNSQNVTGFGGAGQALYETSRAGRSTRSGTGSTSRCLSTATRTRTARACRPSASGRGAAS